MMALSLMPRLTQMWKRAMKKVHCYLGQQSLPFSFFSSSFRMQNFYQNFSPYPKKKTIRIASFLNPI